MRTSEAQALALLAGVAWALIGSCPAGGAEDDWVGYRGPRASGVFAGSRPPVDCDMKTGRNIRWRAPLPNWCSGSPIVVKDRVFALSEPGWKHDWPVLTCIDATNGKVLWERQVNHLPATGLDPVRQAEIVRQWAAFHDTWRKLYSTFAQTVGQKKPDEAVARFEQLGFTFGGHKGGGYGQLRSLGPKPADKFGAAAGLHGEAWHHGCGLGTDCIGMAFAAPVSDGQHVYVTTTFSGAACFDFDGNLRWLKFVPTTGKTEAYARSPLLWRDLVVSDYFGKLVAFDKATGEVRWIVQTQGGSIATPAIITVGGKDIVLSEGKQAGGGYLSATNLADGKPLKIDGWGIGGTQIMVNTDQPEVAFFCGRGQHSAWSEDEEAPKPPTAVRFALDGQTLKATVLWTGKDFVGAGGYVGMLYHGGKLYCGTDSTAVVIDAATGKLLAGTMDRTKGRAGAPRPLPLTRHLLLLAGDRFYGLDGSHRTCDGNFQTSATLSCHALDGKPLGQSVLLAAPVEGDKLEQIRSQVGWDKWPFSYGLPFTIGGDRIYVRSFDEIICIGER
jgi:hypothetical protein